MVRRLTRACVLCGLLAAGWTAYAADAPDGTTFEHPVLGVDGPGVVRIKFCGMPVKVQLADVQLKGEYSEKQSEAYLKEALASGAKVTLVMEQGKEGDGRGLPQAHVFKAGQHVNLEMVKRGLAVSDGGSKRFGAAMQKAQMDAMTQKAGMWSRAAEVAVKPPTPKPPDTPQPAKPEEPAQEVAAENYSGPVVADLQAKEYHLPGSRYAKGIRAGARIEYPTPEAAERAGKTPSPFSFPERSKAAQAQHTASKGGASKADVVKDSRAALQEALGFMQEARKAHGTDHKKANANWQKAAKILAESIDRLTPVADAHPNDNEIQRLAEEMSMNLYSCNKYQSL